MPRLIRDYKLKLTTTQIKSNAGFYWRGETGVPGENLLVQRRESTNRPTYDAASGNRTRAILVGGWCSHHCAIPAPPYKSLNRSEPNVLNRLDLLNITLRLKLVQTGVSINFGTSGSFSITGGYYVGRPSFLGGSWSMPPPLGNF